MPGLDGSAGYFEMWVDLAQVKRWRMQAEEIRTYADNTRDLSARDSLRRVAADYDRLADRAEQRPRPPGDLRLAKP